MLVRALALLSLTAATALSSPAHAVGLNARGLGQALIYPYYTVNKGQDTLLTVVNDGDLGTLALVVVDEGYNGRPVKFFDLFLAPHDVWTARVSALAENGGAALYSADTSCTWPPLPPGGFPLTSSVYTGGSIFPPDGGPSSITRTREGFIQVIALGAVIPDSPLDLGIRHPSPGAAPTCANADNSAGSYLTPPAADTLGGSAAIVNVGEGTFFAYAASALDFTEQVLFSGSSSIEANPLRLANSAASTFPTGAIAHVASGDEHFAIDYERGIDAVSAIFMQESIANDYLVAAGLGAHTDWVLSFPTKALYTDPFYLAGAAAAQPFTETFHAPGMSNVLADAIQYDQEEGHGATGALTLPYLVNVVSFSAPDDRASGVLGSMLVTHVAAFSEAGTMTLDLAHGGDESHALTAPDGRVLHGLPATGFMVYNIINANAAPGKLANYGGTFPYRSTVSCT
ncbi:hypothetical protein, partial [Dokdonella sp.]|uniref:hypothetical protein n=1 Tax=Dokdonella sp. TaxID=2291710 RepID=UPI002F3F1FDE